MRKPYEDQAMLTITVLISWCLLLYPLRSHLRICFRTDSIEWDYITAMNLGSFFPIKIVVYLMIYFSSTGSKKLILFS